MRIKKFYQIQIFISVIVVQNWKSNHFYMNNAKIVQMVIMLLDVYQIHVRFEDHFEDNCKNRLAGGNCSIHPGFMVPIRGRNIEFRRALRNSSISSIRPSPRAEFCPFTQCFSRHTDKGTQIPRENPFQCRCVCHNEAHILTHACVRESWQLRREISYEITGSHCHKPRVPSPLLLPLFPDLREVDH